MISSLKGNYSVYSDPCNRNRPSANPSDNLISSASAQSVSDTVRISHRARELSENLQAEAQRGGQPEELDSEEIWDRVAAKYDVRHMTMEEMARMSQELYDEGAISLFDHALMSLDLGRIGSDSAFLTGADNQGNRDWVAEFEERLAMAEKFGDAQSAENNERILGYLTRLDSIGDQASV